MDEFSRARGQKQTLAYLWGAKAPRDRPTGHAAITIGHIADKTSRVK